MLILHVIDSLSRGGAEILLSNTIPLLPQFKHVVVLLEGKGKNEISLQDNVEIHYLEFKGWRSLLKTVFKLKKLIDQLQPLLVHSHLFNSTLCARLAVPATVPLVSTIHSLYSKDAFEKNHKSLLIERLTIRKRHTLIAVSRFVLDDYLKHVPFQGRKYVLYNFIPYSYFKKRNVDAQHGLLKSVAVGNLKEAKNYPYLLSIFRHLKEESISLDIYGTGTLEEELQITIDKEKLNVRLYGGIEDVSQVLQKYNLFIQASSHEGFGLSVIEAMAAELSLIVSDIPVFKEVTNELAHFFPLDDASKAAAIVRNAISDKNKLQKLADEAFTFAQQYYSEEAYKKALLCIYEEVTNTKLMDSTCVG